jgi:uncharacterized caspase-like protein
MRVDGTNYGHQLSDDDHLTPIFDGGGIANVEDHRRDIHASILSTFDTNHAGLEGRTQISRRKGTAAER